MGRFEEFLVNEAKGSENDFYIRDILYNILGKSNVKGSTKGRWHIRSNVGDDPVSFFQKNGFKVEESDKQLSQQYTTYKISIDNKYSYFVNTIRYNASINTKDLTPESFYIVGRDMGPTELYNNVKSNIDNLDYSNNIKMLLIELLEKASGKGNSFNINSYGVNSPEIRTISNDFGEILCALWSMKNIGFRQIHFPSLSNEPLLDYYGISGNIKYPVSVKSGGGSATSLKNISNLITNSSNDVYYRSKFTNDEIKIIDIISLVPKIPVMDGFVDINKKLRTDGLLALSKIFHIPIDSMTLEYLENVVNGRTSSELKPALKSFYDTIGNYIDDKTWDRFDKNTLTKPVGVIIGPLGHYTVKVLNSKENIKILSDIASKVVLLQHNISITDKKMSFKYKRFRDFEFKFSWQGGAPNPNRNKLGFKAIIK